MADVNRNPQLDGLRGYAAVAVAIYHAILQLDLSQIPRILAPTIFDIPGGYGKLTKVALAISDGKTAVVIFFVLSGAVLFGSLRRHQMTPFLTSIDFTVRRFFRIYPAFFVCLLVCMLVFALLGDLRPAAQYWENALLFDFPFHGASWTLQVEFLAIPFILVSYGCYRMVGPAGIVAAYLPLWLVLQAPGLQGHFVHLRPYVLCFTLGFLIPTSVGAWVAKRFPVRAWPVVLIVMLAARHTIPNGAVWTYTLQLSAGLLVALLYYGRAGGLDSFLQRPISRYLGRISYSFYLFNVVFLRILSPLLLRYTPASHHPLEYGLLSAAAIIALTIPVAHLSERYIERPFIKLGRRVIQLWEKSPVLPSAAVKSP